MLATTVNSWTKGLICKLVKAVDVSDKSSRFDNGTTHHLTYLRDYFVGYGKFYIKNEV